MERTESHSTTRRYQPLEHSERPYKAKEKEGTALKIVEEKDQKES